MTAPVRIDPRTLKLAGVVQELVDEAVRLERIRLAAIEARTAAADEILKACRRVGAASDAVEQARFAGNAVERKMLARLERAAKDLADVMRKGRGAA